MTTCDYILVRFTKRFELLDVFLLTPSTPRRVLGNIYFNVVELIKCHVTDSSEVYEPGK